MPQKKAVKKVDKRATKKTAAKKVVAKRVLFVFAGAFGNKDNVTIDDMRDFGLRTEFVGRVGLVFNTTKISLETMLGMVPKVKLLEEYLKLFKNQKKDRVVDNIRKRLRAEYAKNNSVGLRLLHTLIHQHFMATP